jgi:SAM-dependent methyltransferase
MSAVSPAVPSPRERYLSAYARLRESEGRGRGGEAELLALPHLDDGPLAAQWAVRARTYECFLAAVVRPLARLRERPLRILDLGAGNGWLSYRMSLAGHTAVALDLRCDAVDGLAAGAPYARHLPRMFGRVAGTFEAIPLVRSLFDVVLFNASLHYAEDLTRVLSEAARAATSSGRVAILDSPFYRRRESGEAMAEEKRRSTRERFGELAEDLLSLRSIEYLTKETLAEAARPSGLRFRRHRVLYPLWYEARAARAFLKRQRPPSRFDLWVAETP